MHDVESTRFWRANALRALMGLGFLALIVALFSLQVVRRGEFSEAARENRQFRVRVPAPRGRIHDRNGTVLVDNRHQARLSIAREHFSVEDPELLRLAERLQLDAERLAQRASRQGNRVTLLKHADIEQIAVVEEQRARFPHVTVELGPRREYRFGPLAAHLIGYVGEVGAEDVAESGRFGPYAPGEMRGVSGLESFGEELLRGRPGLKLVEVDAAQRVVGELAEGGVPVVPGVHFFLTISQPLQAELERLLDGRTGSGVVVEVPTGDVLAAASAPGFEPNMFLGGISDADWNRLEGDPRKPLYHRTLRGAYPPGSPYKLISAACALENGVVTVRSTFEPCTGAYRFGNRIFRCWERAEGHGIQDLRGAIVESCDVYFYQLAQLLTIDQLAATARRFGLGAPTGIELRESAGLVPDREFYDGRFGRGGWTTGVLLNNAIGQGELLVTPLQLARAFAALGGDGHLYRPSLVLARENASGVRELRHVRRQSEPVCDPAIRRFLKRAMLGVVADDDGTGELAAVPGVAVAGKTGTAENPHGDDHAWFVAYAPAADPEIAIALIIENAGHGGSVAAPIVGQLLRAYFGATDEAEDGEVGR